MNLLDSDISTLTTDQWSLLSNLIQIYQESQLVCIAQRLTQTHLNTTDRSSIDLIYGKLIQEWMMSVCETTSRYLRLNSDICHLPPDDRSLIIRTAAANVSCMGGTLASQNYPLYEIKEFTGALTNIYGQDVTDKHRWSMKFMDSDPVLLKLGLSLFVFSELNYSYTSSTSTDSINPLNVVKVQNKYAEVTWTHLLYRYGHDQAVRRFNNLISWFLATTVYMDDVQNVSLRVNDVTSLVEETELKLVLDDVDRIVEIT